MLAEYKTKTNIGIGIGLLIQFVGRVLTGVESLALIGFLMVLVGYIMFIWGCGCYAIGKGYSQFLGLLGIFSCLGLLILAVLPDKHKTPPGIK
ncbi:MAG TPA: hypothetical protein VGH19_21605 [Verrucomicrobiae bacterium]